MEVSTESYPDSGVYVMRHLEMYMGDIEKWNTGFKKFNVSSLFLDIEKWNTGFKKFNVSSLFFPLL